MSDWLLPQHDLPGKEPLPEAVLYRRRERVFLLLASLFVAAAAIVPLVGVTRVYGVSFVVRAVGLESPRMLLVPIGVLAFPVALLALNLVTALYGRRRARALALVATIVWAGVLGLTWATDHVPDYDATTTHAFAGSLAVAAAALVTCIVQLELFGLMRGWIRHVVAPVLAIAAGWGAFVAIAPRTGVTADVLGIALGGGGYEIAIVLVGALLAAPIGRALVVYLRVPRRAANEVDDDDLGSSEPAFVIRREPPRRDTPIPRNTPLPRQVRQRPYTTEEIRFFEVGDSM